jgi:hypothetical protein
MDFSFHYGDWILGQFYYDTGARFLLVGEKREERKKGGKQTQKLRETLSS